MAENFLRMDEPITRGPPARWQKKRLESSNSSINVSLNISMNKLSVSTNTSTAGGSKTPSKRNGSSDNFVTKKTPSKTPKKSPGSRSNTPGKGSKTPNGGDRFIPARSASSFDLSHYLIHQQSLTSEDNELVSPSKLEAQRQMSEHLHGGDVNGMRILTYRNKAPSAPDGYQNRLKVVYSNSKTPGSSVKASSRYIPHAPDRILDAPDIVDDYYVNLIDWSSLNILAVALSNNVYLWNAASGTIEQLCTMQESEIISSVSWTQEGSFLAIGISSGAIDLWDCGAQPKKLRTMNSHSARVGSLCWNAHVLTSGSRSGQIVHHDVRQREHVITTLAGHTQEVCGLKWSPDYKYMASGGNDNLLNVWAAIPGQHHTEQTPLYSFSAHQAAVKALAWCPWQTHILASGGGTNDRCIRFWNCNTGVCVNTLDTGSQVCGLLWSLHYREFVSGHGYANNQLVIWKYPALTKVAELTGHTARVLHLVMSPDGTTVLSAGADETLRLWKCFAVDATKKKKEVKAASSIFKGGIR